MKASVLALILLVAVASAARFEENQYQFLFARFASQHGKKYENAAEFQHRYQIFKSNLDYIAQHNDEGHSYTLGVNEYADLTHDEFVSKKVNGLKASNAARVENGIELPVSDVPDAVDWREKNAVTPVKNQEQCGSCWAFSTTGAIEGAWAAAKGELLSLSEQELVDCAKDYDNDGCNGGLMDNGFKYVIAKKGLCLEDEYKYTAKDGTCVVSKCKAKYAPITGFTDVKQKSLDQLQAAIAVRPVAVAIEADQSAFQFYSGGVFDASCGTNLDHGVLAVGYGTESGKKMWIVKNSWGASWGDKGYIKMIRTTGTGAGQCGIAMMASYATL